MMRIQQKSADYGNIIPHPNIDKKLVESDIWKSFDRIYNWNDRYEVITKSHGMPTIQLAKPKAQEFALDFINRLRQCGVDGLRLDSGKSIALPEEGNDFLRFDFYIPEKNTVIEFNGRQHYQELREHLRLGSYLINLKPLVFQ